MASLRYEQVKIVNTYAWISDTAISNPTSAIKMAIGSSVTKNNSTPLVKAGYRNPLRILSNVCMALLCLTTKKRLYHPSRREVLGWFVVVELT